MILVCITNMISTYVIIFNQFRFLRLLIVWCLRVIVSTCSIFVIVLFVDPHFPPCATYICSNKQDFVHVLKDPHFPQPSNSNLKTHKKNWRNVSADIKVSCWGPCTCTCTLTIPARSTMASLPDKIEFDRVKIVDSESNLNPWKNSHKMSKKDHPTMIFTKILEYSCETTQIFCGNFLQTLSKKFKRKHQEGRKRLIQNEY